MELESKLIDFFTKNNICSQKDIQKAQEIQKKIDAKIGTVLLNSGIIHEQEYILALSEVLHIPLYAKIKDEIELIDVNDLELVDIDSILFEQFNIYPFFIDNDNLYVALDSKLNYAGLIELEKLSKKSIKFFLATSEELNDLKNLFSQREQSQDISYDNEDIEKLKELASEAPVIKMINNHFAEAVKRKSSDIHYESDKEQMRVRLRIDGTLQTIDKIPQNMKQATIARLKLLSKMNISENRLPQDGRISLKIQKQDIDIRVSSVPTAFGESFVLRLLGKQSISYSLESLEFFPDQIQMLDSIVSSQNGIFLTTGPTGSGKTTTLYSLLNKLNNDEVKIISVEDPVEYKLQGINQIQVKSQIGFTFATALRSILRQDPDIIMVGEIRDEETARISIQSALTGHMVLSTLHTNSALGAITRLIDMGIEYFLLKSSIKGLMAQRLARKLCDNCKKPLLLNDNQYNDLNVKQLLERYQFVELNPHQKVGCKECNYTGFKGRIPIAEIIPFTDKIQTIMQSDKNFNDLSQLGYRTLYEDAMLKFLIGSISLEEALKVKS